MFERSQPPHKYRAQRIYNSIILTGAQQQSGANRTLIREKSRLHSVTTRLARPRGRETQKLSRPRTFISISSSSARTPRLRFVTQTRGARDEEKSSPHTSSLQCIKGPTTYWACTQNRGLSSSRLTKCALATLFFREGKGVEHFGMLRCGILIVCLIGRIGRCLISSREKTKKKPTNITPCNTFRTWNMVELRQSKKQHLHVPHLCSQFVTPKHKLPRPHRPENYCTLGGILSENRNDDDAYGKHQFTIATASIILSNVCLYVYVCT